MGFGARSPGLAMTGTSYTDGYESAYLNPAGLGGNGRMELMVGTTYGSFQLRLDGRDADLDPSHGMTIGFQLPLPFGGPLEDVLTLGAGFFSPFATVLRNDIPFAETPQWSVIDRSQVVALQVGLGINLERLVPGLRVGIGIAGLARTVGRLDVALDETNQFVSLTETQLMADFSPVVGVQYRRERWGAGIVYRSKLESQINLDIRVTNLPIALPVLGIQALAHYDPHAISAEGYFRLTEDILVALNLTWRHWSAWPGASGNTTENSNFPPSPNFEDTVSPRAAVEWAHTYDRLRVAARGGFAFEPTPAPPAAMAPVLDFMGEELVDASGAPVLQPRRRIDSHRYIVSLGFGLEWQTSADPIVRLDVFGQMQRVARRTHNVPAEGETENMQTDGFLWVIGWTGGLGW